MVVSVCYRFALGGVGARFHSGAAEDSVVSCPVYPLALLVQALCIRIDAVEALVSRRARYREARTGRWRYRGHYRSPESRVNRRDCSRSCDAVIVLLGRKEPVEAAEVTVPVELLGEPSPVVIVIGARGDGSSGSGDRC